MVNFWILEADLRFVTYFAAVKHVENLVAFAIVGRPVDHQESLGLAVDAEFFAQLSAAC